MTKANNKTVPNAADVDAFLAQVEDPAKREDCYKILSMMEAITKEPAKMWGGSIIGFGVYQYKYASGREGEWFLTGFSPRKNNFSLYIMSGFEQNPELMEQLGKYKTGKSCLYINKLSDVDEKTLQKLIKVSADYVKTHQSGC